MLTLDRLKMDFANLPVWEGSSPLSDVHEKSCSHAFAKSSGMDAASC